MPLLLNYYLNSIKFQTYGIGSMVITFYYMEKYQLIFGVGRVILLTPNLFDGDKKLVS